MNFDDKCVYKKRNVYLNKTKQMINSGFVFDSIQNTLLFLFIFFFIILKYILPIELHNYKRVNKINKF